MKGFKIIKPEKKLVLPLFQGEVDMIDHLFNQKTYRGASQLLHCPSDA